MYVCMYCVYGQLSRSSFHVVRVFMGLFLKIFSVTGQPEHTVNTSLLHVFSDCVSLFG